MNFLKCIVFGHIIKGFLPFCPKRPENAYPLEQNCKRCRKDISGYWYIKK